MGKRAQKRSPSVFVSLTVAILSFVIGAAVFDRSSLVERIRLYARIAELYTEEPDRRLAMPVENTRTNQIANTWGAPRPGNRRHAGQDIFAPRGTPVYSATPGYIYNVGENRLGGRSVWVVGKGGRVYYYAHLDCYAPNIAIGDRVNKQTLLGYVGTSGNAAATPPHLHFGVYTLTGAMNPLPLLVDRVETPNKTDLARRSRLRSRR